MITRFFESDFIEEVRKSYDKERKKYEEDVLNSQAYKQSSEYMDTLIKDFHKGLIFISIAATRDYTTYIKNSALMFGTVDLNESAIAINKVSSEKIFNVPKRELRYMLEATIKYAAVDQIYKNKTLEEKLNYLYTKIPRSSISPIDELKDLTNMMVTDTKELYSLLSQFIHPSQKQITEYQLQLKKGKLLETHKELDSFNRLLFRTFDTILYLIFINMGSIVMKDTFKGLQDLGNWKFFKGKHVKTLSNKYSEK